MYAHLEGKEKISTIILSEPAEGKPGIATITIEKVTYLVTSGVGAVNNRSDYTRRGQTPEDYNSLAKKGNITLKLNALPGPANEQLIREASTSEIERGNYYLTTIVYNYTLVNRDNVTLKDAMGLLHEDPAKNGFVVRQMNAQEIWVAVQDLPKGEFNSATEDYARLPALLYGLNVAILSASSSESRAAGLNETNDGVPYNITMLHENYRRFGSGELTPIEDILHEGGHNDALGNYHSNPNYNYSQEGTQSNTPGKVYHTKQNTLDILNDKSNQKNSTQTKVPQGG